MVKYYVSYPVQEFMLKTDTMKNGMSYIGLYGSAPPPLGCCFYCPDKNNVRTANAGRTAL